VVAALALFPIMSGCDRAKQIVSGGDSLVDPSKVSGAALKRAATDKRLAAFYEARRWRAAWTPGDGARLQDAFEGAWAHGIDPVRFQTLLDGAETPVEREVALTKAALTYGDALAHGLADPSTLFEVFALERNDLKVDASLQQALSGEALEPWLEGLAPRDAGYAALSKAYLTYREQAGAQQAQPIPEGKPLKPGGKDPRIPQIAAALQAGGYLLAPAEGATPPVAYDSTRVEAMKAYQNDHGINADGVVGADTIAVINAGPDDRARQIALNLEARRWLKRDVPEQRIDVNTAAAFLEYYRNGQRVDYRRVVAGKPGDETPHLSGGFKQLVVNPPWNVPESIATEEILPKGAGYLAANDMSVIDGRVVQEAGPKSALGLVKFDMQNRYAIYLHDTPAKDRFQENERHFSHGCVRVADAVQFAQALASERGKEGEFQEKLAAGDTATVDLGTETPVRLVYHTVFVDPDGRIGFRPDVYGWDAKLATALGMNPPMRRGLVGDAPISIGP
jgi:murein L,D-transpeptidase YcbB/YkuD